MSEDNKNSIKFIENFCLWGDLLGYGKPFYDSKWDLHSKVALHNINRINMLKTETTNICDVFLETIFTLNDGFIRIFDIPSISVMSILRWLNAALLSFHNLNMQDIGNGFFGIRGVLAYGERVQYIHQDSIGRGEFIQTSEAKKVEYNLKKIVYTPGELQMNTAFSKAYIIESSGSKMGIAGNMLYIDVEVIDRIVDLVNEIGRDRILLTDEDEKKHGHLHYNYFAKFERGAISSELLVTVKAIESEWEYFKIVFEKSVYYNNPSKAICTELFVPKIVSSSLYSQHDKQCFEM